MRGRKRRVRWLLIIPVVILCAVIAVFAPRLEGESPKIAVEGFRPYLGADCGFTVTVSDKGSGLRHVKIVLQAGGRDFVLSDDVLDKQGPKAAGPVMSKKYKVRVEPRRMGIPDGPAVLSISAEDLSLRNWMHGNLAKVEKNSVVDTRKPDVSVLSRHHYVTRGGSGLVVYRVMEKGTTHGVQVGDNFFPGYDGLFDDETVCLAFFAVDYRQDTNTPMFVVATDRAGNRSKAGFYYRIRPKKFAEDTIRISDGFLNMKMPEFDAPGDSKTPIEKFVWINSVQRGKDTKKIANLCRVSDSAIYWKGPFLRFPNSARRAGFGDKRQYIYNGRTVSHAVHMGVDLASVAHSPVPAANNGKIVFCGRIGIFGKTVVIDHGCGLFSMYSHLSSITVHPGRMVARGDYIGTSGMTGLAGGDHLHFGMMIHGVFVDPVEWWDGTWIENNITSKIEAAGVKFES